MSIRPDALVATLSRDGELSNDRLHTLVVLIQGLISARTVNLSHIAGAFCGPAKLASNYRRLQRFFQYVELEADWLAKALVALLRLAPPYQLCLDRTEWKVGRTHINLLVLCIAMRRVRIPILWHVLDRAGASSTAQRKALLERFIALFGKGSIKLLLADREFNGNKWFEFLVENDIPFAIRVSGSLIVHLEDGYDGPLERLACHSWSRRRLFNSRGCFQDMDERFAGALAFGAAQRPDGTLMIVATNRSPTKALNAYRKRWQIECLFADTKTRGFNIEDTRLTSPAKLSMLLAVIALAMAWAHACAVAVKGHRDIARAKHGYRRKSWFRTGFDILRHWIATQPDNALNLWIKIWRRAPKRIRTVRVV